MTKAIQVESRTGRTKSLLKQLRAQGRVPAVVYGNQIGSLSVSIGNKEIADVLKRNPRAILEMELPTHGKQPVLIHQVQRNPISGQLLHIDFQQINMNEKIDAKTVLQFVGEPAGVKRGGILQIETYEIEIRCMPNQLPESIEVDISGLDIGDQLQASDLVMQNGIEVITDPSTMLVNVLNVQKSSEAAEPADDDAEKPEAEAAE